MEKARDTVAVICEYNPLHCGHERLFSLARELYPGCDIISVMSGNTVQRGDLALYDRYKRANAAVACGSCLVLELPYPYSCASAEQFAAAGVYIAAEAGARYLIFGCGVQAADELFEAASVLSEESFMQTLRASAKAQPERSFPSLRAELYQSLTGKALPKDGNSSLGIEYIIAVRRLNERRRAEGKPPLICRPITRIGSASATACRSRIRSAALSLQNAAAQTAATLAHCSEERGNSPKNTLRSSETFEDIPENALKIFESARVGGGMHAIGSVILAQLRAQYLKKAERYSLALTDDPEERGNSPRNAILHRELKIQTVPKARERTEGGNGIRDALLKASLTARDIAELEAAFPTATYTRARLRRELLDAVLLPDIPTRSLRDAIRSTAPQYTVLLAATADGLALLSEMKRRSSLAVVTKPSDTAKLTELGAALYALSERAEALFALSFSPPLSPAELIPRFKAGAGER